MYRMYIDTSGNFERGIGEKFFGYCEQKGNLSSVLKNRTHFLKTNAHEFRITVQNDFPREHI